VAEIHPDQRRLLQALTAAQLLGVLDRTVRTRRSQLRHLAGWLIAGSVIVGIVAIAVRASWGSSARALEGATLFLAAAAYLAHVVAHHEHGRELLTKSILVTAFALWGILQIAPTLPAEAVLNDVVIALFVIDLAIIVSPWT
jgi:hypothetical protein